MNTKEKDIAAYIQDTFEAAPGRVVVASVASNIMRVQQILNAAAATGRKVILSGHDLEQIIDTAMSLNKLKMPEDDLLITLEEAKKLPPEELVVLETGKMGEPIKALQQIANGDNKTSRSTRTTWFLLRRRHRTRWKQRCKRLRTCFTGLVPASSLLRLI